jgi:endonuclease VIII
VPEGDTIHRIAAQLAPRLTGKTLERVTTQGLARDLAGRTVLGVAAHGKHLVIELDNGASLRAHLGMNGRFRAYRRAEGDQMLAKLSPGRASLALVTDDGVFLWIGAPTIEVSHRRDPRHGMAVAALGPDILSDAFDHRVAAARAAEHGSRAIAEVLLDQRIAAGIGNVYKSEALFCAGIDPRTPVARLAADALARIYELARAQMLANLGPGPRTTRASLAGAPRDARYFVYSRTGKPCTRCGTAIQCVSQGDSPPRWTWWCPTCQPARSADGAVTADST